MRLPGSTPSIWRRLEALGDSEFNSGGWQTSEKWHAEKLKGRPPYREWVRENDAKTRFR
jgi:hypothetical protein